ncbi:MAG: PaaI family thioesterase [Halobacteriales archaeon]
MKLAELFSSMPFARLLGIEVTRVEDGVAEARMSLTDEHTSNPTRGVAHGGVAFALADTVAGAAVVSLIGEPAPTVDMRIDYLKPATDDLRARAEVVRRGNTSAVVDVTVRQDDGGSEGEGFRAAEGDEVARVRGVFKLGVEDGAPHDWTLEGGHDSP